MLGTIKDSLYYDSGAFISLKNWKLSLLHRFIQLVIVAYIIGWSIIWKKSYQTTDAAVGTSLIKVRGVGINSLTQEVYDSTDLTYLDPESAFIKTAFVEVTNQTRGRCSWTDKSNLCSGHCVQGKPVNFGIQTGICANDGYCEVKAWCPSESPNQNKTVIDGIETFKVFIRQSVLFPTIEQVLDNDEDANSTVSGLNIWSIEEILKDAGVFNNWSTIQQTGAILLLRNIWDCDFDEHSDTCMPKLKWQRLDDTQSTVSMGYNFRDTFYIGDGSTRTLTHNYGLKIVVMIFGTGSKFDLVALLTTLGSGLALLGVASIVVDFIALYLTNKKRRGLFRREKFRKVREEQVVPEGEKFRETKEDQTVPEGTIEMQEGRKDAKSIDDTQSSSLAESQVSPTNRFPSSSSLQEDDKEASSPHKSKPAVEARAMLKSIQSIQS